MKRLCFRWALLTLPLLESACQGPMPLSPLISSTPFLKTVTEARYTPDDSLTITSHYDQTGQLQGEDQRGSGRSLRIVDLYDPKNAAHVSADRYRLHVYDGQQKLIATKQYFKAGQAWLIYDSDSLVYVGSLAVRQLHYDHFFIVDGGQYSFSFPLWLTAQTRTYDAQSRVSAQLDSVFITHDIPAGGSALKAAPARYLHTNKTTYSYNEKGLLAQTVAISGEEPKSMVYSNGWSVLNPNGRGYAASVRQRFMAGTTTYAYEYSPSGQLSAKNVAYTDGQSPQSYVSRFTYQYATVEQ